jgi:hypothetical protein
MRDDLTIFFRRSVKFLISTPFHHIIQSVSKKCFTTLKAYIHLCSVLNCHNVANHTESYLGWLRFNVTSTGNVGRFKKALQL